MPHLPLSPPLPLQLTREKPRRRRSAALVAANPADPLQLLPPPLLLLPPLPIAVKRFALAPSFLVALAHPQCAEDARNE